MKYMPGPAEPQQLPGSVLAVLAGGGSVERLGFQGQLHPAQPTLQVHPSSLLEVCPGNPVTLQRAHHRLADRAQRKAWGVFPVQLGVQGVGIGPLLHNHPNPQVWKPHAYFKQWDTVPVGVHMPGPMALPIQHLQTLRHMQAPGNKPWGLVVDALNVGDARQALDVMCAMLWYATTPVPPNGQPQGARYNQDPMLAWCRGLAVYPNHYQLHPVGGGGLMDGCASIFKSKSYNYLTIEVWPVPAPHGHPGQNGRWKYWVSLHRLLCWLVHGPPPGRLSDWHVHHVCKNKWCLDANHLQWMPSRQHSATAGRARVAEEPRVVGLGFGFRGANGMFVALPPHPLGHVKPMAIVGAKNKRPRLVADVWQQGVDDVVQGGATVMEAVALKSAAVLPIMA
jgi:hypothetical protein